MQVLNTEKGAAHRTCGPIPGPPATAIGAATQRRNGGVAPKDRGRKRWRNLLTTVVMLVAPSVCVSVYRT